jgi:hypothetical protein
LLAVVNDIAKMMGTTKFDCNTIASREDEADAVDAVDNSAVASRLTAAALHLMSAYAQCACPKLAVIVEAHIAELARVTPDACVRAVCEALHKNWSHEVAACAAKGCFADNVNESIPTNSTLMQKIRQIKFH